MNELQKLDFLEKFNENLQPTILKYLPIRKTKIIKKDDIEIIILEPLVKHILGIENNNLSIKDLLLENSTIKENEFELLPFTFFKELQNEIIELSSDDDNAEKNEDVKKK